MSKVVRTETTNDVIHARNALDLHMCPQFEWVEDPRFAQAFILFTRGGADTTGGQGLGPEHHLQPAADG